MKSSSGFWLGWGVLFTVLLVAPLSLSSQDSPQKTAQPPVRVTTHLVQVGVIVRDSNGPVSNLTKDDFTVLDRGKPQTISTFHLESPPPAATTLQLTKPCPKIPSPICHSTERANRGA